MNRIVLPVAAICLGAFGITAGAPPARASAEGRRNTAILLGLAAAIAADRYADKRAEETCRSGYSYREYQRHEPRCRPPYGREWRHCRCCPREPRHADVVVRVERHEHYYCDVPCGDRACVGPRRYDDGPAYWREPWAR